MTHYCPHANRNCSATSKCTPCSGGGVLKDGEAIVTRMMLRDSATVAAQRAIDDHTSATAAIVHDNFAAGQRTVAAMRNQSDRVAAFADHWAAKAAKRDAELTRNGYDKSLDFKPYAA